jgi:hypothetical protein
MLATDPLTMYSIRAASIGAVKTRKRSTCCIEEQFPDLLLDLRFRPIRVLEAEGLSLEMTRVKVEPGG